MRHFLKETDLSLDEVSQVFALAADLKANRANSACKPLSGESWGLLFFKKSTRTRVSFQVGVHELGGHPVMLNAEDMQLARGETPEDTAKVLSRYLHGVVIRCHEHSLLETFAQKGTIPVVNALSDFLHPCQFYTDMFTLAERWSGGDVGKMASCLRGRKIAFVGDTACNMGNTFALGCAYLGMEIVLCGPAGYEPQKALYEQFAADGIEPKFSFTTDPEAAAKGADMIYTDVWVSMGMEEEKARRLKEFRGYQVDEHLMSLAKPDAFFMHCLPAHIGEEVSAGVLNGPQSIVFDQAENRLHTQKAILAVLAAANKR
ncbi:MAG: ornithine carbamoyltransferase [Opitutae bacterium]|nr:ornithine carbamoyltransferase [Opitutae bacterium]